MNFFSILYDKVLNWAKHKYAPAYLALLSFSESVFFPIPPDVMLAPMALSKPDKAWRFALYTSIASVLGGMVGYLLGYLLFEPVVQPVLVNLGYEAKFATISQWFKEWGIWVVFLAGFSPIPYKLFTITAGVMQMAFLPFVIVSAISRSMRFYLVAGLMKWGGKAMEEKLRLYVDRIGWGVVIGALLVYVYISVF
ncbi:MAG: membrane protein YqaA with SNARE-associated domain [Alteromonadaceae bacterium]